jgi:hypothetical protein
MSLQSALDCVPLPVACPGQAIETQRILPYDNLLYNTLYDPRDDFRQRTTATPAIDSIVPLRKMATQTPNLLPFYSYCHLRLTNGPCLEALRMRASRDFAQGAEAAR